MTYKKGKKGKETVVAIISHLVTGAIELHRLAVLDFDELERRKDEITENIVNAKCSYQDGFHTEVMQDGRVAFFPYSTQVTPLFLACEFKVWKSALLLLNAGADPNKARKNGNGQYCTPLFMVAYHGSKEVCRKLLACGASQDIDTTGDLLDQRIDSVNLIRQVSF